MRLNNLFSAQWRLGKSYGLLWFWGSLALLIALLFELFLPITIAFLIDNVTQQNQAVHFHLVVLLSIGALALQAVLSAIGHYSFATAGSCIARDVQQTVHKVLVKRQISFFDRKNIPDLSQRISNDIELLLSTLNVNLAKVLKAALLAIGSFLLLLWLSFQLSSIVMVLVPFSLALRKIIGQYLTSKHHIMQQKVIETSRLAQEDFTKIRLIHAYNQQNKVIDNYANFTQEALLASVTKSRILALFQGSFLFVRYGMLFIVFWLGSNLIQYGDLSLGHLVGFILYTAMLVTSAFTISEFIHAWKKASKAYKRIVAVLGKDLVEDSSKSDDGRPMFNRKRFSPISAILKLSLSKSQKSKPVSETGVESIFEQGTVCDFSQYKFRGGAGVNPQHGSVELRNINFAYPNQIGKQALTNFSLRIREGERVALVGASGAGKSTIANLLLGFYPVHNGQIFLDGVDVNDLGAQCLREHMAIVEQEPTLHSGTILENIAFSADNDKIDEGEVFIAARRANADEFIQQFPNGYDTVVGKRSVTLTIGQKQRIAIARALFKDPSILILDEATSALDSTSEFKVQQALDILMRDRTTIIIANRLSTVVKADRIVVMEQGQILQAGSHAELSEDKHGAYQQVLRKYYRNRAS